VFFPVVGQRLVESSILFLGDVLGVSCPKRLVLVEEFPVVSNFLDLLLLVLLFFCFFDLLALFFFFVIRDFLFRFLCGP